MIRIVIDVRKDYLAICPSKLPYDEYAVDKCYIFCMLLSFLVSVNLFLLHNKYKSIPGGGYFLKMLEFADVVALK
jgi:hypothetical protein